MHELWRVFEATAAATGQAYAPALVRALVGFWRADAALVLAVEGDDACVIAGQAQQRTLRGETVRLGESVLADLDESLSIQLERCSALAGILLSPRDRIVAVRVPATRARALVLCAVWRQVPPPASDPASLVPFAMRAAAELDSSHQDERLPRIVDPLTTILGNLHVARSTLERSADPEVEVLAMLREAHDAALVIAQGLRPSAELEGPRPRCNLDHAVDAALALSVSVIRRRARLVMQLGARPLVDASHEALVQSVLHVLLHAAQSIPEESGAAEHTITIATSLSDGRAFLDVRVSRERDADRDEKGRAHLELPRVRPELRECCAELEVKSLWDGSRRYRLVLDAEIGAPADSSAVVMSTRTRRVLVLEDDAESLRTACRTLSAHHEVVVASSVDDAIGLLRNSDAPFDAVVCGLTLLDGSGVELHRIVACERPSAATRFVFVADGNLVGGGSDYVTETMQPIVFKPLQASDLVRAIEMVARPKRYKGISLRTG